MAARVAIVTRMMDRVPAQIRPVYQQQLENTFYKCQRIRYGVKIYQHSTDE